MACSYGGAGALWKIFARADVDTLRAWLWDHIHLFEHHQLPLDPSKILDPIHDQVGPSDQGHRRWQDMCGSVLLSWTSAVRRKCLLTSGSRAMECCWHGAATAESGLHSAAVPLACKLIRWPCTT